jgi:hypothetical protein
MLRALLNHCILGSDVDIQTMAIAQRYVDGEITIDELTAAIEARSLVFLDGRSADIRA